MQTLRDSATSLICLLIISLPAYGFSSATDSGGDIHDQITRDALGSTISDANLRFLIKAMDSQDTPGGEGKSEARRHFEGGNFAPALSYIDREKKRALNYAADADNDPASRAQALRHFGLMLHTVQDFYARTNYVEIMLEDPNKKADPYNIELVDWSRVPDGYAGKKSGASLVAGNPAPAAAGQAGASAGEFNKDNAATAAGKTAFAGTNAFKVARELAVRETQRQWNLFEALIRARAHGRADAVIAALKQASPGNNVSATDAPDLSD